MKQVWEPEELIAFWALVEDDWRLLGNKTGATRLGFALVLKYVEIEGEFPHYAEQIPAAVDGVAGHRAVPGGAGPQPVGRRIAAAVS